MHPRNIKTYQKTNHRKTRLYSDEDYDDEKEKMEEEFKEVFGYSKKAKGTTDENDDVIKIEREIFKLYASVFGIELRHLDRDKNLLYSNAHYYSLIGNIWRMVKEKLGWVFRSANDLAKEYADAVGSLLLSKKRIAWLKENNLNILSPRAWKSKIARYWEVMNRADAKINEIKDSQRKSLASILKTIAIAVVILILIKMAAPVLLASSVMGISVGGIIKFIIGLFVATKTASKTKNIIEGEFHKYKIDKSKKVVDCILDMLYQRKHDKTSIKELEEILFNVDGIVYGLANLKDKDNIEDFYNHIRGYLAKLSDLEYPRLRECIQSVLDNKEFETDYDIEELKSGPKTVGSTKKKQSSPIAAGEGTGGSIRGTSQRTARARKRL